MRHGVRFVVIDKQTGEEADDRAIAESETWAVDLMSMDLDGWALTQDGCLMMIDECGQYAFPDNPDRFEVRLEREP